MNEQSNFENEWKSALDGAETTPPTSVWSNVRADISASQAQKQSSLVVYWRWMAAASITLLLGVGMGSIYYYQMMNSDYQKLVQQEQILLQNITLLEEEKCDEEKLFLEIGQSRLLATEEKNNVQSDSEVSKDIVEPLDVLAINDQNLTLLSETDKKGTTDREKDEGLLDQPSNDIIKDKTVSNESEVGLIPSFTINEKLTNTEYSKQDQTYDIKYIDLINDVGTLAHLNNKIQPRKVPDILEIVKMQQGSKQDFRGLWAGLSIGGGSFNTNINKGGDDAVSLSNSLDDRFNLDVESLNNTVQTNQEAAEAPTFSYAIGADFGKQIGRKTFVQGGVEYNRYATEATSNAVTNNSNNDPQTFLRYENTAALDKGTLTTTEPYKLANNYQYVAIPIKFGYQLLNKKIGISVSSGVSSNFFLKNTLKDKSGNRSDVEVTNGERSPYKPLNFNGLFGAEISYQWNEYYQLAIVPDYRFSLDGVTKTDAFFRSNPTAFFLGFRFKYILK